MTYEYNWLFPGERKRKLTSAVLSDYHGAHAKKGRGRPKGGVATIEEEDIGAIGRLLQKSLQRRKDKNDEAANVVCTMSAVEHISSVDHDETTSSIQQVS